MNGAQCCGAYDQGSFNAACSLVDEMNSRNYIYFNMELDVSGMDSLRALSRMAGAKAPSYTAFVVKAAGCALSEHPNLNCMIQETPFSTRLVRLPDVTATIVVERNVNGVDMVFAPALPSPDRMALTELTGAMQFYAEAPVQSVPAFAEFFRMTRLARWLPALAGWLVRVPALSPRLWRKYRGGAFAVISPAKYGGPDAILAPSPWPMTFLFGSIKARPWVEKGQLVVRKTMRITITVDRRLADGAPLARFAARVRALVESPGELVSCPAVQMQRHSVYISS